MEFYELAGEKITCNPKGLKLIWKVNQNRNKNTGKSSNVNIKTPDTYTTNPNVISQIIIDILNDESNGKIDPLQDYSKQTLKGFLNFIETDFKAKSKKPKKSNNEKKPIDKETFDNEVENLLSKTGFIRFNDIDNDFLKLLSDKKIKSYPWYYGKEGSSLKKVHKKDDKSDSSFFLRFELKKPDEIRILFSIPNNKLKLEKIQEELDGKKQNFELRFNLLASQKTEAKYDVFISFLDDDDDESKNSIASLKRILELAY